MQKLIIGLLIVYSAVMTFLFFNKKDDCFIKDRTVEVVFDGNERVDYSHDFMLALNLFEQMREQANPIGYFHDSLELGDNEQTRLLRHKDDKYEIIVLPTMGEVLANHYIVSRDTLYKAVFLPYKISERNL